MGSTPFDVVVEYEPARRLDKATLFTLSRRLESAAIVGGATAAAATLQDARHLGPVTRANYAKLAVGGATVRLFARGLQSWLAPGVEGVALEEDDRLVDQWCVVLVGGAAPAVLAATDLYEAGHADADRSFLGAVTYDAKAVEACARLLLDEVPGTRR